MRVQSGLILPNWPYPKNACYRCAYSIFIAQIMVIYLLGLFWEGHHLHSEAKHGSKGTLDWTFLYFCLWLKHLLRWKIWVIYFSGCLHAYYLFIYCRMLLIFFFFNITTPIEQCFFIQICNGYCLGSLINSKLTVIFSQCWNIYAFNVSEKLSLQHHLQTSKTRYTVVLWLGVQWLFIKCGDSQLAVTLLNRLWYWFKLYSSLTHI